MESYFRSRMAESDGSRVGGGGVELGAEVDIPASALVYAWIPFSVVVVATFIFSSAYVSLYKHKKVRRGRGSGWRRRGGGRDGGRRRRRSRRHRPSPPPKSPPTSIIPNEMSNVSFSPLSSTTYSFPQDSACSATLTSILGVTVALLLAALAPVDIFLVSFMKNADGTFKVSQTP